MIKRYHLDKVKWIADGGDTFQDSVMRGINNLKNKISLDDYVMWFNMERHHLHLIKL